MSFVILGRERRARVISTQPLILLLRYRYTHPSLPPSFPPFLLSYTHTHTRTHPLTVPPSLPPSLLPPKKHTQAPVIFFCRNNGYAISTPVKDQFRGDGIVSRAAGYGMHAVRVDGNDLLAVFNACAAAREVCVKEGKPVLVEAMTYRVGHHSTSDDSTRYRSLAEIKKWHEHDDPLKRFRGWMEGRGWWSQQQEQQLRDEERMAVLRALERAEVKEKPGREDLFTDVYKEKPRHLVEQEEELEEHVRKYPEVYGGGGKEGGH